MKKKSNTTPGIEQHPWEPFAPANAKVLFLGSFHHPAFVGQWNSITPT